MDAIFQAVRQAMSMVSKLFSAGEKFASAAEHIGTWTDESAAAFSDEARHKRKLNLEIMRKEFELTVEDRTQALDVKKARKAPQLAAAK